MLRQLVRLGFHDCTSARCDGCIDVAAEDNPGMAPLISILDQIHANYPDIGRADLWAAAATMAAEECSNTGPTPLHMPLFFGRVDAAQCGPFTAEQPEGRFPDANQGLNATLTWFDEVFNMNATEAVIMLGAHTLGVASPQGSGHEGSWTVDPDTMDNSFYSDLTLPTMFWEQGQPVSPAKWQWTANTGQLMLNSDVALYKDIFAGSPQEQGQATCTFDTCASTPVTAELVEKYAVDNEAWIRDFGPAFAKMLTKGSDPCALEVVPSNGSGPEAEALHGLPAIQAQCAAVTPVAEAPAAVVSVPTGALPASTTQPASGCATAALRASLLSFFVFAILFS